MSSDNSNTSISVSSETTQTLSERLAPYADNVVHRRKRQHISQLPRWVRAALTQVALYGITIREAAKEAGKAKETLAQYAQSPAGRKLREQLDEIAEDPVRLAEWILKANAHDLLARRYGYLEMAEQAADYAEADKIARDLMDRTPGMSKKGAQNESNAQVNIHLPPGWDAPAPIIESDGHLLEDADFEVLPAVESTHEDENED